MLINSLDNINPSNLKKFFRELCIIYSRHPTIEQIPQPNTLNLDNLKKYRNSYVTTENMLKSKIQQLEEELQLTKEEKSKALEENKRRIDNLSDELMSIKNRVQNLIKS